MASPAPRVFTIPPSAPFLPTLIEALLRGRLVSGFPAGDDPLALVRATLYLPTRRAGRLLRETFLDVTGQQAAILPRIVAIGDVDEDEIAFAQAATPGVAADALELPPALGGLERRLLLAQLVGLWAEQPELRGEDGVALVAGNPAAALALADDLARLMDDMTTRNVAWRELDRLVPDKYNAYWQLTLRFLEIARAAWPAVLAERGAVEPAARRDALIKAEAARLAASTDPVIVAGSTGSMPATAALIATIAKLPHGAVVLPGLDTDLDAETWELIAGREQVAPAVGHPQFAMQALLKQIGIAREEVEALAPPAAFGREGFASEAFRPAVTTELWRGRLARPEFAAHADAVLENVCVVEAANPEEESLAIAIALREAPDQQDTTAALVTPDRALARRVVAALERWQVAVDDSGGDALADTQAGIFARLAAEAALRGLEPVTLLALLKHPLLRLGAPAGRHARAIAALERAVLRGPRPRAGTDGLAKAVAALRGDLDKLNRNERSDVHRSDPRARLSDDELQAAADLVVELTAALGQLECLRAAPHPFNELASRHHSVIAALSDDGSGAHAAFAGADGAALATALDEIAESTPAAQLRISLFDYAEMFAAAIADRVVRRPSRAGVRVRILGPLEARLTTIDRVVLGGLNEGTWPPETRSDAWLSRPMRLELGLDLPERRISLSAHDFAQMLGAREVILTRAAKAAGAPTVAARFVQRLAAVAGARWDAAVARGGRYLALARRLDAPGQPPKPVSRPEPKPPIDARPTRFSVTEIEQWLRDPYSIYAKHILRLTPLDAVDTPPGAADRGTAIHNAIGEFTETYANALPDDPLAELLALGRKYFAPLELFLEARAFWWPRFERIARWFARWETERRAGLGMVHAEIRGEMEIPFGTRALRLSARADRIERLVDGRYAILDYKTGQVPTTPQVQTGLAPQLTLEGAILRAGKFPKIEAGVSIDELTYISLKGGNPPGEAKPLAFKDGDANHEADTALRRLAGVAARFAEAETPYRSRERPMWMRRGFGDYDHLARVREWSLFGGADDEWELPPR